MEKIVFEKNGKNITDKNIISSLIDIGLCENDDVCVHTELFKLGTPKLKRDEFLKTIIKCFYEVIGKGGTLIMPTFTYSFCKNEAYDKINSKSSMGILTEFFRKQDGTLRSDDPIFSFAIKGKREKEYMGGGISKTCFAEGSVYDILLKNNGKIVHFGNKNEGFTFSHFVEENLGVDYRYFKKFSGDIIYEDGTKKEKTISYFVRKLDAISTLSVSKNINILINSDNFKEKSLGGGEAVLMNSRTYFDAVSQALKKDKLALVE